MKRKKFNYSALSESIDKHVENGIFLGQNVGCREEVQEIIAKRIGCDLHTVRKWGYNNSNGPKDPTWIEELEKVLDVKLTIEEGEMDMKKELSYTEHAKENIESLFKLMKDYITSLDVDNEECLCKFWHEFGKYRAGTPLDMFNKLKQFGEENFDPIIYDFQKVCPDGRFETFIMAIVDIDKKLDAFAEQELNPVIVY